MKMLSVKEVEKAIKRRKEMEKLLIRAERGKLNEIEKNHLELLVEDEKDYRINHLKCTNKLTKEDIQDITKYINECIERQKEDREESYDEEWTDNTLYIPLFPTYGNIFGVEIYDYHRALNAEIIRQMVERGYKYHVCDEDIEFWK